MNKSTIILSEFAVISNLTPRHIRRLGDEGKLPKVSRGKLPWPQVATKLFEHYQKVPEEMAAERLALVKANRVTKELELAVAQGKYVLREVANCTVAKFAIEYHGITKKHVAMQTGIDVEKKIMIGISDECARLARGEEPFPEPTTTTETQNENQNKK
jgi:hypothetical protein